MANPKKPNIEIIVIALEHQDATQVSNDSVQQRRNFTGSLNPMTIELIIQNVVQFMHIKELKTCRLLNSTWEKVALNFIKKKCKTITFNQDHSTYKTKHYKLEDMITLLKVIKNSRKFPCSKFNVETDLMENPFEEMSTEQLKTMADFYEAVSPFVNELTIRLECENPLYIGELTNQLKFPELKVLNIEFNGLYKTICGIEVIKRITDNAPNLDKISFSNFQSLECKPESAFIKLLDNSQCKYISSLDICGEFTTDHVVRLEKLGLQLKSLYINLFGWNVDSKTITKLFKSQQDTLTHLMIEHRNSLEGTEILINFPQMTKLTSLVYKKSFRTNKPGNFSFSNISYVKQFPMLKCLSIESNMWEQFFGFNNKPVNTVEELVLNGRISNTDCLLQVARLFPKLRKIELPANINVVNTVYNEMKTIVELVLDTEGVDSVNDIITGLDCDDNCQDLKIFEQEFDLKLFKTKPISSLKRLNILKLKGIDKDVELNKNSCWFLLKFMDSLQCLDFCGRVPQKTKISDELLEEMRKKFLVLC